MIDVLIGLALLAMGFAAGRRFRRSVPALPPADPAETRCLQEDRAAFAQLMGYNADRAYGLSEED